MTFHQKLAEIQAALVADKIDGWLFYDFRRSNDLACSVLEIPSEAMLTRRWLYWIPLQGEPVKVVHCIEPHFLDGLPGEAVI